MIEASANIRESERVKLKKSDRVIERMKTKAFTFSFYRHKEG